MPSGPVKLFRMCGKKYFGWLSVEAASGWSFMACLDGGRKEGEWRGVE